MIQQDGIALQLHNGNSHLNNGDAIVDDNNLKILKDDSILSTDAYIDQLIPMIKKSIKLDSLDTLLNSLEDSIYTKENELETLSFNSSRDVTTSIDTVKQIKQNAGELSQQVMVIQKNLLKTGYELTTKKRISLNYKKIHNKINETAYVLQSCLHILEVTNKIMEMISRKQFYNALKLLDDLTNLYASNDLFDNFEFTKKIYTSIPQLRAMCKDNSINDIKKWLTNSLERNFAKIGEGISLEMNKVIENWVDFTTDHIKLQRYKVNSGVELSMRPDSDFDPLEEVDLKPLFDGILVFETLSEEESLRVEYHSEWITKRDRLMKDLMKYEPTTSVKNGYPRKNSIPTSTFTNLDELRQFVHTVLGFLISDHLINIKTSSKLRSDSNLKDLYDSIVSKAYPSLLSFLNNKVHTLQELEKFKDIMGLFVQSLCNYGYDTDQLYNILISAFKKFTVLSFEEFKKSYQEVKDSEDSLPMTFSEKPLYLKICAVTWYPVENESQITMPKSVPFSSMYPLTCIALRNFIESHELFCKKYFSNKVSELDKILVNSVDNVLSNIVVNHLTIKLESTIKEEIAQNLINLEFFSSAIKEFEKLISLHSNNQLYLKSYSNFIQLRKNAESKIFEMVDSKVLDLIEFAQWDFSSKVKQNEPSIFIKDIGEFLEMMFNTNFNNLPTSIRQLLLFRSFDLISDHFLAQLRQTTFISNEALHIFDMDVTYLESIINTMNEGVKLNQEAHQSLSINSTFIELNQVVDLMKSASFQYYKQHQNTKFTRIKADEAINLLDKMESVQLERQRQLELQLLQQRLEEELLQTVGAKVPADDDNSDLMSVISNANTINGDQPSSRFARFKFRNRDS